MTPPAGTPPADGNRFHTRNGGGGAAEAERAREGTAFAMTSPTEAPRTRRVTRAALALFAGPLAARSWSARIAGLMAFATLTVLTQLGGFALWPLMGSSRLLRSNGRRYLLVAAAVASYSLVMFVLAPVLAGLGGRVRLPCLDRGSLRPRSLLYCATGRNFVAARLRDDAVAIAREVERARPGTAVYYLDGGFPVGAGFPMLPHLSHGDGRRLDLALYFLHADGSPASPGGSPIGYFGYARMPAGRTAACPAGWRDLRWDLPWLQRSWRSRDLDAERTAVLVRAVVELPGIRAILLEPHIRDRLDVTSSKIRFQGCGAARHDDHVHLEVE